MTRYDPCYYYNGKETFQNERALKYAYLFDKTLYY